MRAAVVLLAVAGCGRGFFNTPPVPIDGPPLDAHADAAPDAAVPFAYIQGGVVDELSSNPAVTLPLAQHAGDLEVVVVFWLSGAQILSVTDGGDAFAGAIGPQMGAGGVNQEVFIASDLAAGTDRQVSVSFTQAVATHVLVAEYAGVTSLDTTNGAFGTTTPADSGSLITTHPDEYLVGVLGVDSTTVNGMLEGYNTRLSGLGSADAYFLGDVPAATTGGYDAKTTGTVGGDWIAQVIALKR